MPTAHSNGYKINYEVTGDGPVLLLHPGMYQVGSHWRRAGYTAQLAKTHTVVTVDPLGLGASDAPRQPDGYTMERRAAYVVAILDDLGVSDAAMWGYSLGALTGYAVAIHAPRRLNRLVAGAFDPVDGFASALELIAHHFALRSNDDVYAFMEKAAAEDPAQAEVIAKADPAALRANFTAFSAEPGVAEQLAKTPVPLLMYAGSVDIWHRAIRSYATRIAAPFFTVPDCDHVAGWNSSETVLREVLPFLRD